MIEYAEGNIDIDALTRPFPPAAIEQRDGGGGRSLSYVATETVIRRLNHATGNRWSFRVTSHDIHPWRDTGRGDPQTLLVVYGELTIPGLGTRSGAGVQLINPNGGEDMLKGAASDCLKKCATLFGVAIDLYGPDLEAGELPPQATTLAKERDQYASAHTHSQSPAQPRPGELASDAQKRKIWAMTGAKEKNWSDTQLHFRILVEYACRSLNDLSKRQASDLIEYLMQPEAPAPPEELAAEFMEDCNGILAAQDMAELAEVWKVVYRGWEKDAVLIAVATNIKDARKAELSA